MITAATVYPVPLRNWPTGIAVLTTADRDGWWWGCTATSMASVSVRPPLVSVSLPKDASCRPVFASADAFAVHVLRAGQEPLAGRFAAGGADFAELAVECGFESVPLLSDVAIRLECRPVNTVAAGDNVLLLGEVVRARTGSGEPLVHLGEGYRRLARPA